MKNQYQHYTFDEDVLREMESFKKEFLSNQYMKDKSENTGPNYKEKILLEDQKAFEEYLNDTDSRDFLDLK